jgi:serine/threonine protein phosphatase PrpC
VTAGFKVGKVPETCEDAFFITERGFGVADGVSGWNDYGFSSSAFANQLMDNSKAEIENYLLGIKSPTSSKKKLRKTGSFLSMDNLGVASDDEESLQSDCDAS